MGSYQARGGLGSRYAGRRQSLTRCSRSSQEIAGVRVERVQQISEADARAEGVMIASDTVTPVTLYDKYADPATHVDAYADLWDSINGARGFGWDANPWVWVLEFRRAA